jgi:hypothetical protein
MNKLRKLVFGISPAETSFIRRGFHCGEPGTQRHLERVGQTFVRGYNAALTSDDLDRLTTKLDETDLELRGFAYEGAAMALSLLDYFMPWKGRLDAFLNGSGKDHAYMVHVGAGWTLARLPRSPERMISKIDPLLGYLAIDGYGFHEGYFHARRSFDQQAIPRKISGYAERVFDQGLGRSLWFVTCADIERVSSVIASFPESRRADLWSGIGLACSYAGAGNGRALQRLRKAAQDFLPQVAQGAAFAAKARERAGNPARHTELACRLFCGLPASAAAAITDTALDHPRPATNEPLYEVWRQTIQSHFAKEAVTA